MAASGLSGEFRADGISGGAEGELGMAQRAGEDRRPEPHVEPPDVDGFRAFPIDPDVDGPTEAPRPRWPRIHWVTVAVVTVGGFVGGLARYGLGLTWPTPTGGFPWSIWTVNTVGSFILGLLLVLVLEVLPPTRYVRALVGTGFCGALTTFSSVTTGVDQLTAHGHAGLAAGYVLGSLAAGLAAAALGIVIGRSAASYRKKGRD
jgi:CrcB protein